MSTMEDLSKLLQAERNAIVPSSAVERGWQRLSGDLAANVAPLPVASGPIKLGLALLPKWILTGFAVGLVGVGATASVLTPRSAPYVAAPHVVRVATPVARGSSSARPDAGPEPTAVEPLRAAAQPVHASPIPSGSTAATFDAELKLISIAKSELDAHRPQQARAWLTDHAERFPNGVFAVERDALRVLASCEQGPKNEALARHFAEQHPGSPHIERLERACRASDATVPKEALSGSSVDFSKLPNGSPAPGERIRDPDAGEQP